MGEGPQGGLSSWDKGVQDERAAVVRWLRGASADTGAPESSLPLVHDLAQAIEKGEHRG